MNWDELLRENVLAGPGEAILKEFLLAQMPPFQAPVDPAAWAKDARQLRRRALGQVYLRGFPRTVINARPRVVWGDVLHPDKSYVIRKLRYEIYPDYWIPALLYEPRKLVGRVAIDRPELIDHPAEAVQAGVFAGRVAGKL